MTITIKRVGKPLELYRKYKSQMNPQDVYIQLDPRTREVHTSYNGEIGNAVPMDAWNGLVHRWTYPNHQVPTMESANAIMEQLKPKLEAVCNGDEEAILEVGLELESALQMEDLLVVWEAGDWLTPTPTEELGITAETTDEELEEIGRELTAEAHADGIHCLEGLEEELEERRDQLRG